MEERQPQGAVAFVSRLPMPHEQLADSPVLMEEERLELEQCELAIDHLRVAFWAAGKALQAIRDGKLYREQYNTFPEYLQDKWDMSESQAYRLIEAWPLAERIGTSPIGEVRLTESHIRALMPVAKQYGDETAVTVYQTVAETPGRRVTADLLAKAAKEVPATKGATEKLIEKIKALLTQEERPAQEKPKEEPPPQKEEKPASAVEELDTAVNRVLKIMKDVQQKRIVERAAAENRELTARILKELEGASSPLVLTEK